MLYFEYHFSFLGSIKNILGLIHYDQQIKEWKVVGVSLIRKKNNFDKLHIQPKMEGLKPSPYAVK